MTDRKDPAPFMADIEKPHETVADSSGDGLVGKPITVRLGDLWSDFIRVADEGRDPESPKRPGSAVPLLDDMKGILQWD
ncbi:MAG: hypothetical protein ACJ79B_09295 [Gemmatimonadaceae bacterium]